MNKVDYRKAAFNRLYCNVMDLVVACYPNDSDRNLKKRMRGEYDRCLDSFFEWYGMEQAPEEVLIQYKPLVFFDYAMMLVPEKGVLGKLENMLVPYDPEIEERPGAAEYRKRYSMGCLAAHYLNQLLPGSFVAKNLSETFQPSHWMEMDEIEKRAFELIEMFVDIASKVATPHVDDAWSLACREGIIRPYYQRVFTSIIGGSIIAEAEANVHNRQRLYVSRISSIEKLLHVWGGVIREYNSDKPDEMKLEYPAKDELASCLVQEDWSEPDKPSGTQSKLPGREFDPQTFLKVKYKLYRESSFAKYKGLLEGTREPR